MFVVAAGAGWGLAFDAAAFIVSAASLWMMRLAPISLPPRRRMLTELREGWHAFRSRTWLLLSVLFLTVINAVVVSPLYVLGPKVALQPLTPLTPRGLALAGPIAAGIGVPATLYSAAAFSLLLTLCALATPAVRNVKSVPAPAEAEPGSPT
ncbi:MAG: hypothetical protein ACRDJX_04025 [Solirubrobacteraceae bacterium]